MKKLSNVIYHNFSKRPDLTRPYIVAWDGLSGAGKTTIAQKLRDELQKHCHVLVLHIDDYLVERMKRYHTGHEEWYEYYYLQWDVERLVNRLFSPLFKGSARLTLPYYDRTKDEVKDQDIEINSELLIIIEGIFLQREEWKDYYDFIIFHHCPAEIRHKRALARDTYIGNNREILTKYEQRYWLAEEYYVDATRPMDNANFVYSEENAD